MRIILPGTALALSLLFCSVQAQEAQNESPKKDKAKVISASQAEKYLQQSVTVTGMVAQVTMRDKLVFLNLDKRFPNTPLSCVIFSRSTNQFGDLKALEGKQVEIKGKVETYNQKPQIVLSSTNQLRIVESSGGAAASETK